MDLKLCYLLFTYMHLFFQVSRLTIILYYIILYYIILYYIILYYIILCYIILYYIILYYIILYKRAYKWILRRHFWYLIIRIRKP